MRIRLPRPRQVPALQRLGDSRCSGNAVATGLSSMKPLLILFLLRRQRFGPAPGRRSEGRGPRHVPARGDGTPESEPYLAGPDIERPCRGFAWNSTRSTAGSATAAPARISWAVFTSRGHAPTSGNFCSFRYRLRIPFVHPYALVGWVPEHTSKSTVVTTGIRWISLATGLP